MPLFEVPEPPPYSLTNAPLAQALGQVRYPLIAQFQTMAGIAPLQNELRGLFPYMEQERVQEVSLLVGPAGPAAAQPPVETVNWNLTNDQGMLVVVGSGSATLSLGSEYTNVEDFAGAFKHVVSSLATVGVPRCDRLGVRYLSIAPDLPGEARAWREWFRPELLGIAGTDVITTDALFTSMTQVQLSHPPVGDLSDFPADVQGVVRYGAVPAGTTVPGVPPVQTDAPSYLLDLDLFVTGAQPLDAQEVVGQFRKLHREIDTFFHWSLTPEGGKHFGLKARSS